MFYITCCQPAVLVLKDILSGNKMKATWIFDQRITLPFAGSGRYHVGQKKEHKILTWQSELRFFGPVILSHSLYFFCFSN